MLPFTPILCFKQFERRGKKFRQRIGGSKGATDVGNKSRDMRKLRIDGL
jgi:hypothetical protein